MNLVGGDIFANAALANDQYGGARSSCLVDQLLHAENRLRSANKHWTQASESIRYRASTTTSGREPLTPSHYSNRAPKLRTALGGGPRPKLNPKLIPVNQ